MHEHPALLGRLQGSLHTLEMMLRLFILRHEGKPFSTKYFEAEAGSTLTVDEFTDGDTVGDLVARFNEIAATAEEMQAVDRSVVDLAAALSRGRIAILRDGTPPRLLKLSAPHDGVVDVEFAATMSASWLYEQIALVTHQHDRVLGAASFLGLDRFIPTSESGA